MFKFEIKISHFLSTNQLGSPFLRCFPYCISRYSANINPQNSVSPFSLAYHKTSIFTYLDTSDPCSQIGKPFFFLFHASPLKSQRTITISFLLVNACFLHAPLINIDKLSIKNISRINFSSFLSNHQLISVRFPSQVFCGYQSFFYIS